MKVVYQGPFEAVTLPWANGLECKRGVQTEVPDWIAEGIPASDEDPGILGLLEQADWRKAGPSKKGDED